MGLTAATVEVVAAEVSTRNSMKISLGGSETSSKGTIDARDPLEVGLRNALKMAIRRLASSSSDSSLRAINGLGTPTPA